MQKRIEELEAELEWKNEQLEDSRKALNGVIEAEGNLSIAYTTEGICEKWEINTSDILTKLIKEVGRLCDSYASDLFVQWKYEIENKLDNGTLESSTKVFAIREGGVDHKPWYELHKDERHYYRAVWFLDIETTDRRIRMVLHK